MGLPVGPWLRLIDFLAWRFPAVGAAEWAARLASGDVVNPQGQAMAADQAYQPHGKLYYYRCLPPEPRVAGSETVLFEDELLVVADKPHFLPVTPSGVYLQETLLVRLRRRLGLDDLAPVHRIDRETAGLVLFTKQPATRRHYQALFAQRQVQKTYEAIAPWRPDLAWPITRASVMVDGEHFMQMCEVAADVDAGQGGPPNAITTIDCLQILGPWARYRLRPLTGQRHQLRVHMAALGLPILGDQIYPVLGALGQDDAANPLRLLAQSLEFRDPVSGVARHFVSERALEHQASHDALTGLINRRGFDTLIQQRIKACGLEGGG